MDIIFNKKRQRNIIILILALAISGCAAFDNEPQIEITVMDSNQNLVENATVTLFYATNSDYDFEGGTQSVILTEKEWVENYAIEAESSSNINGKVLFTELSTSIKYCRINKGMLNNNLGIQWVGMANENQLLKLKIEIK